MMSSRIEAIVRASLLRLGTLVLAICAALLLGEGALRLLGFGEAGFRSTDVETRRESRNFEPDFRDRVYELDKKPREIFRIVVIGDSFTWGAGVHADDAYPDRLQRRIASLPTRSSSACCRRGGCRCGAARSANGGRADRTGKGPHEDRYQRHPTGRNL